MNSSAELFFKLCVSSMVGWPRPLFLGFAILRGDPWELAAQLTLVLKQHAGGDDTRNNAVPEESPFGGSQRVKTDHLRQPILKQGF